MPGGTHTRGGEGGSGGTLEEISTTVHGGLEGEKTRRREDEKTRRREDEKTRRREDESTSGRASDCFL